jgi:hypothetical protein
MGALGWMLFIVLASFLFWQVLRRLVGLRAALDRDTPLFPDAGRAVATAFVRLEGVQGYNPDGSRRQEIIRRCGIGERLRLVESPAAGGEEAPVRVLRADGGEVGELPPQTARAVAESLRHGLRVEAAVCDIVGSTRFPGVRELELKISREVPGRTVPHRPRAGGGGVQALTGP